MEDTGAAGDSAVEDGCGLDHDGLATRAPGQPHEENSDADEFTDLICGVVSGTGDRTKDRDCSRLTNDRREVVFDSGA